jgi:hypothetical protein
MRIRRIVMVGLGIGAVALVLAGCTQSARGEGFGQGGGQGDRGARHAQDSGNAALPSRGSGRGRAAQTADGAARGAPGGAPAPGRGNGIGRSAVDPASDRTGRDVAGVGALETVSGTLSSEGVEWYLDTADGRYLLHLGNASYVAQVGLALEDGERAVVRGLVDADEVSVISIEYRGATYALRSESGAPLWAGRGRGAGRGAGQGIGRAGGSGT